MSACNPVSFQQFYFNNFITGSESTTQYRQGMNG